MAIRNIKEVINNRGYVLNSADRKIFDAGNLQSFFGLYKNDTIEFIIYDINDNQLPQQNGDLVRYIPLSTENINDYFLVADGTVFQRNQLPNEYFIDVERLLMEAGYTSGIFKTQTTLLNKRVGSEQLYNKLWIQEISPSRTEVRLLPLIKGLELNDELQDRYNALVNDKEFRDDTILYAYQAIEQIKPTEISAYLTDRYNEKWYNELKNEFKISSFDVLVKNIYDIFVKSIDYEFTNRISDHKDVNYGKLKTSKPLLTLSKDSILNSCRRILVELLDYYLPSQDVKRTTKLSSDFIASIDNTSDVLQSLTSDTVVASRQVEYVTTEVKKEGVTETVAIVAAAIVNETGGEATVVVTPDGEPDYIPPPVKQTTTTATPTDAPVDTASMDAIIADLTRGSTLTGIGDPDQIAVRTPTDPFSAPKE